MSGLDLDKVLSALADEGSGIKQNSDSLMGLMGEVNRVLGEAEKSLATLERMHVLPAIIRMAGKKYDVDVETPLNASSNGVEPASDYHRTVYEKMNSMTPEEIGNVLLNGAKNGNQKSISSGDGDKKSVPKND